MGGNTTIIDIVAQVTDETASGSSSAQKNLSKLEKSMQSLQQRITDMKGKSKLEIAASLKDMASKGLAKIAEKGKSLAGKAWTVTMKLKDLVTAPFRGIAKMLANPIVQIATIAGVSLGAKDTIDTYKSFQQGMANVKAISNATEEDFNNLTACAKEMGETTMFSASQAAEAMENLAMAGWKAKDIISGMPGLLSLAAAGSVDLATASDVVSGAIAQYKMEADQAGKVADILAATATNSKTDVQGLGESLKYAGTMAGSLGYSLEDTVLALALMGNANIDASSAGSSVRMIFARMSKQAGLAEDESNAVSKAMKQLGVSLTDSKGKMKSMLEVMNELRTGYKKLKEENETAALAAASNLAGTYSMTGLLAIVDAEQDKFDELTEAIYESKGAAARMADVKMDTLQGSMYNLQSKAEGVKIAIGEKLEPYLRGFIDWLTSKMPTIKEVALDAMDFLGEKIEGLQKKITEMTQSNEWKGAITLWDKIKVAWNKIIAEPFDEWWNSSGRDWLSEKANGVGKFMGNFLKTGLLTLLGVDVGDALNDGMAVGKSFMDGFLEGFDVSKVLEGVKKAFKSIVADAGTDSSTSGLSRLLLGIGALKIGSVGVNLFKGGKAIVGGVKGIVGAIKGVGAAGAAGAGVAGASAIPTWAASGLQGAWAAQNAAAMRSAGAAASTAGAAGAGIGSTVLSALGAGAAVGLPLIVGTVALFKNTERLNEVAKDFVNNTLFNNGLPKLTEYTAAMKANNAETYRLATRINKTTSELEGIQAEMQDATTSLNFFGTSLRENGTLSPEEAQNMIEPFNQLCDALENDFSVRYNNVFDAFKEAAGKVAESLGADVATISATLDKFKEKYTGIVNDSQTKVNGYLEKQAKGEQLSNEELADLQNELKTISAYAGTTKSENLYNFEQKRNSIGNMDLGKDKEQALANLTELGEYSDAYISELTSAMKQVNLDYENLRGVAKTSLDLGKIDQSEYDEFIKTLNMAQAITYKSYSDKIDAQQADMIKVRDTLLNQVDRAIRGGVSEKLNDPSAFWSLEALSGVFGGDTYYAFYNTIQKDYQDLIDNINKLPQTVGGAKITLPVDVQVVYNELTKDNTVPTQPSSTTPPSSATQTSAESANGGTHHSSGGGRHRANGGILTGPEYALVGEDGAEAIIPLSSKRRERGLALWQKAGEMLGVSQHAEGGIIGAIPSISSSGNGSTVITVEVGGIVLGGINISSDINDPEEIVEIIRENIAGLTDDIAYQLAEKLQAVFSNMPIKAGRIGV